MFDINDSFKSILGRAAAIGLSTLLTFSGGCARASSQEDSSSNTQIEISQTLEDNETIVTLQQLYDNLESDRLMLLPDNYNQMTLPEKIAVEEKILNEASWIIRAKLALAITDNTNKICYPKDLNIVYYTLYNDGGITWEGAKNNYTIKGSGFRDKKIGSQSIEYIISQLIKAETKRHYNSQDAVTFTKREGTNDQDEWKIPECFDILCEEVLETRPQIFLFNGNSFSVRTVENNRTLNYEFAIEESSKCDEEQLTQEQLCEHLDYDLEIFKDPFEYNKMTLEQKTQLEMKARNDISLTIKRMIAESIGCSPDSVHIVAYFNLKNYYGFTVDELPHAYTTRWDNTDYTIPNELESAIGQFIGTASISHLNPTKGVNISSRYGQNNDPNDDEPIQYAYTKTIQSVRDLVRNCHLTFDGTNFKYYSPENQQGDER